MPRCVSFDLVPLPIFQTASVQWYGVPDHPSVNVVNAPELLPGIELHVDQ